MTPGAPDKLFLTGCVTAIRIERNLEDRSLGTVVELDYLPPPDKPQVKQTLSFEGVINVRIGDLGALSFSVLAFTPIRDWGWDRISYAVEDLEEGVISLRCERWRRIGETEVADPSA